VADESHFVFRQKLVGEDGIVRRGIVMVKQSGLFSPKFGATSSHVFTQSPQNLAVEPGIHSLDCWERCLALLQLLYRWRHQSEIFCISPRIVLVISRICGWVLGPQNDPRISTPTRLHRAAPPPPPIHFLSPKPYFSLRLC
jgi:hypothetical protein